MARVHVHTGSECVAHARLRVTCLAQRHTVKGSQRCGAGGGRRHTSTGELSGGADTRGGDRACMSKGGERERERERGREADREGGTERESDRKRQRLKRRQRKRQRKNERKKK